MLSTYWLTRDLFAIAKFLFLKLDTPISYVWWAMYLSLGTFAAANAAQRETNCSFSGRDQDCDPRFEN